MEPQENKQLALRKAINAHHEAEASLADLMQDPSSRQYAEMLERVRSNLRALHEEAERSDPADRV